MAIKDITEYIERFATRKPHKIRREILGATFDVLQTVADRSSASMASRRNPRSSNRIESRTTEWLQGVRRPISRVFEDENDYMGSGVQDTSGDDHLRYSKRSKKN